jgi:hypothetical protein
MLKYYEMLLNTRLKTLDITSQTAVNDYNEMLKTYKHYMLNEVVTVPKDKDNNPINIDEVMKQGKERFKTLPKFTVAGKAVKEEFTNMNLKDLIAKVKKISGRSNFKV